MPAKSGRTGRVRTGLRRAGMPSPSSHRLSNILAQVRRGRCGHRRANSSRSEGATASRRPATRRSPCRRARSDHARRGWSMRQSPSWLTDPTCGWCSFDSSAASSFRSCLPLASRPSLGRCGVVKRRRCRARARSRAPKCREAARGEDLGRLRAEAIRSRPTSRLRSPLHRDDSRQRTARGRGCLSGGPSSCGPVDSDVPVAGFVPSYFRASCQAENRRLLAVSWPCCSTNEKSRPGCGRLLPRVRDQSRPRARLRVRAWRK